MIETIHELMKLKKISAYDLAKSCNIKNSSFTQWKQGRQKPSADALIKLANFFNVSIDYLVGWTDYRTDTNDNNEETPNPGSSPSEGRKKLIELVENLREENIDKALSYITFLRHDQQCKDKT